MGGRIPDDGNYAEESKQSPSLNIRQQISMSKVFLLDVCMVSVQYGKSPLHVISVGTV